MSYAIGQSLGYGQHRSVWKAALHMWQAVPVVGGVVACASVSVADSPRRMFWQRAATHLRQTMCTALNRRPLQLVAVGSCRLGLLCNATHQVHMSWSSAMMLGTLWLEDTYSTTGNHPCVCPDMHGVA